MVLPMFHFIAIIYPANTFDDPAATDVQPDIPSPTLPHPLPFTKTVELPLAIAAEWGGHGTPGFKCVVFLSPCREIGIPLQKTLGLPCALDIPEQWAASASPILVTAGILRIVI